MIVHLQNALMSRHVPLLEELHAKPILDHAGVPIVVAGNTNLVARLRRSDGSEVAIRISRDPRGARDWSIRYRALGTRLGSDNRGRFPRHIRLLQSGVPEPVEAAESADMPLAVTSMPTLVMEWIGGPTLLQAADRAARGGNVTILRALARALVTAANDLGEQGLVHGDLTASNILVRSDGTLALVDLDSISWDGSPLGPVGHGTEGYRHPAARLEPAMRDRFALALMYVSLIAMADDPDIRRSYGDPEGAEDGVLLFSRWDLADPGTSAVFADLPGRLHSDHRSLLDAFARACAGSGEEVEQAARIIPNLFGAGGIAGLPSTPVPPAWNADSALNRIRARYGASNEVTTQLSAPRLEEELVSEAAAAGWTVPLPPAQSPPQAAPDMAIEPMDQWPTAATESAGGVVDRSLTSDDRDALARAITSKNEANLIRLWPLFANDPASGLLAADVADVFARGIEARIRNATARGDDAQLVALGTEAENRHLPLRLEARKALRTATERRLVRHELQRGLADNDVRALADLAVSGRLVVLGEADRSSLRVVLQAIELPLLQRAIATNDDVLILHTFDADLFADGGGLPEAIRDRVALARNRTAWVGNVRRALKARKVDDLSNLFLHPPDEGTERLSVVERKRIRRMIQQHAALEELNAAIRGEEDSAIISALNKVERSGARVSDRFAWGTIQRVVERVSIIEDIIQAAETRPLDYGRLAQLLPVARTLGLVHDPRLEGEVAIDMLEAHVVRHAHVRRVRAALGRDDDLSIVMAAVPDTHGALDELSEEERDRVARAIWTQRRVNRRVVDDRMVS